MSAIAIKRFVYRSTECLAGKLRGAVLTTLIVAFAGSATAPGAAAAGTLDQQQTDSGGATDVVFSAQSLAQTITAGLGGGLDQVDLHLSKVGAPTVPLSVEIRDVSGGAPGNAVLASQSVQAGSVPGHPGSSFVSIAFSAPAPVAAGAQYAIVAYSAADAVNLYRWSRSATENPYAGGGTFSTGTFPPSGGWGSIARDRTFRTYVVPTNDFQLGKLKRKKKKGIAILTVNVPGPGEVGLAGPGIKPIPAGGAQASRFTSGGEVKLTIKPHKKGKKAKKLRNRLRNKGKARRTVRVTYTPTGGLANTQKRKVKLVKR